MVYYTKTYQIEILKKEIKYLREINLDRIQAMDYWKKIKGAVKVKKN